MFVGTFGHGVWKRTLFKITGETLGSREVTLHSKVVRMHRVVGASCIASTFEPDKQKHIAVSVYDSTDKNIASLTI